VTATRTPPRAGPPRPARATEVLAFEWTKLWSVRSTQWTVLISAVATLGITAIVGVTLGTARAGGPLDPLVSSFLGYAEYAVLPVTVLGVLVFTSEYSTGLIRITFVAVPRRWTVLAAKAAVTGGAALVIGEVLAFACFWLTQALIARGGHPGMSLADPRVPGAVVTAGYCLAACALLGVGIGAIVRHTAGAIAAAIGVIYLLAVLCLILPAPWDSRLGRFTLPFAAYQAVSAHPQHGLLSPTWSVLVLIGWPAVVLLAAALVITRRDV
jgi:ABC-2 type transport system permease protein